MFNEVLQGKCPCCCKKYTPIGAPVAFQEKRPGKRVTIIYALCPKCKTTYDTGDSETKDNLAERCFVNVKPSANSGRVWTITSSLSYQVHFGDFYSAWVNGIDIPRWLFEAFDRGNIDKALFLPGGMVSC